MKGNNSSTAKRVAAEHAPYGFVYEVRDQLIGWHADCTCGMSQRVHYPITNPLKITIHRYEQMGWTIKKNRTPVCATCNEKEIAVALKPATIQLGPDPKIARGIFACLDEHFDDAKKVYHGKWSDEGVAKHLGVSLDIVTNIRKSAYGELAEDPKVKQLSDDIAMLRLELEDAFETTRKTFLEKFNHLDTELSRLRKPVVKVSC